MPSLRISTGTSKWLLTTAWVIFLASIWLFLWYWPWQTGLDPYIWLRFCIGLALFVIPGIGVYSLFVDRITFRFSHITFGFVISHLILALLGTLGRLIHLSFETVKLLMALLGLIPIILYLLPIIRDGVRIQIKPIKTDGLVPVSLMVLVALAACLIVIQRVLTDDDLTYLAYVTNWQNSPGLDFKDVIFDKMSLVHPRFWLMSVPFAEALLADISKVPGILILSGYYEPFLVALSVLCWYELARTLKFSPQAASASAILQLVFLLMLSDYLHPGAPYFTQLSADKATAAFIVTPVFFQSLLGLLGQPTKRNGLLLLLTGLSMTFMHPVILAYSVFIGGVLVLLRWERGAPLSKLVLPIGIFLVILSPQVALRFIDIQSQVNIPYSPVDVLSQTGIENMIKQWGDTHFYGFNPSILDMDIPYEEKNPIPAPVMNRGWLLLPVLSAAFAVTQARRNTASQFILACFLLCLLAGIPFTGWIIGYFLSAWMLERALWLFPFGLSAVYALSRIRDLIKTRIFIKKITDASALPHSSHWSLLIITFFTLGLFFLYMRENNLPDLEKFARKSQRYQEIALAGQLLDHQISDRAYVMGSRNFNDIIPGVSWKAKLITFRISDPSNMLYFTPAEREERIMDTTMIFSMSMPMEYKLSLLRKYNVQYLFLQRDDIRLFNDLIVNYPDQVEMFELGAVIILKIEQTFPLLLQ